MNVVAPQILHLLVRPITVMISQKSWLSIQNQFLMDTYPYRRSRGRGREWRCRGRCLWCRFGEEFYWGLGWVGGQIRNSQRYRWCWNGSRWVSPPYRGFVLGNNHLWLLGWWFARRSPRWHCWLKSPRKFLFGDSRNHLVGCFWNSEILFHRQLLLLL